MAKQMFDALVSFYRSEHKQKDDLAKQIQVHRVNLVTIYLMKVT